MAAVAVALTAAVWALLSQLYQRAIGIWIDHGLCYLLRYLVAVVRLTYLLRRKGRRFVYLESEKYDDAVNGGAVCTPVEWSKECPQQRQHIEKAQDEILFFGVNTDGDRLVVSVSRLRNHVAQLWLALYTRDGRRYSLPAEVTLDRSAGSCFSAAGLRLQCLAPNRRWRVAFNGLLRMQPPSASATSEESEVHVKIGLIWSSLSHTFEQPAEVASAMLAEGCAESSTLQMLRDVKRLTSEIDSCDQAGMMSGEIIVEGEQRELCLWGCKIRNEGSIHDGDCEEDHHIGFLENGDIYHLIRTSDYGGKNGVYYGSIYAPASAMRPIDYAAIKADHDVHAQRGRLHLRSGTFILLADIKVVTPPLVFQTEDSSSEVVVTAVDLKCERIDGSGFIVSVKRAQQSSCCLPRYLKHKIIEEPKMADVRRLVSDINDPCSKVPDLTGGKGSSLAVLDSIARELNTFSVPRGFIVTTNSYKHFSSSVEFRKLMQEMETAMARENWRTALKEACCRLVNALENFKMPADVEETIRHHISKFDKDTMFAVRSSALGEDSEDMSAAGQMTTLLGVRGQENVVSAVVKCWASQFSFTNVNYKRQYGQPLDVPMAVVVQELVSADNAGVMFTCDPLTGNPGYITVTANYGIGESVVSASSEPDTFMLKKRPQGPIIKSSHIGQKSVYTTTSEGGGVATVSLSAEKSTCACISEHDVQTLAAIGAQVEKTYTTPQDIEWALMDGKFFMLQCRPVTTFFRESDCEMLHEFDEGIKSAKEVLTKANVSEVMPGAASPLSISLLRCGFEMYGRDTAVRFMYSSNPDRSQYMPMWGPMHRYSYFLWLSDGLRKTGPDANLMEKSFVHSILGRDIGEEVETGVKRSRTIIRWKLLVQFYHIVKTMLTVSYGVESTSRKTAELHLSVDETSTAAQIHDYMGRSLHHLREPAILLMKVSLSASFYNAIILHVLSGARGALDAKVFSELSKMLSGAEAESADVPRMIKELGRVLSESPEKEKFLKMTSEEACQWLSTVENECGKKYREFIKKHGHRAVKEFDVYIKPWSMDPSTLVKSLKAAAASPQVEQKASSASWDVSKVPYKLSTFQRALLTLVAPKARAAVEAREAAKSAAVRVVHQLRLLCHQLSLRMVHEGRLPSAELLFFLTYEEIGILLQTRSPELVLKAQRRQKAYTVANKDMYPSIFVGIPKPIERVKRQIQGDFEIKGSPMSQGVVESKVRVAPTFEEAHLIQKGEILVTTATDTGWTPYFPLLAGVVTEIGGPLSHGAVVAREYGLPCVVGIEGITTMLNSGDYIQLDGNTGLVKKIPIPVAEDEGQDS